MAYDITLQPDLTGTNADYLVSDEVHPIFEGALEVHHPVTGVTTNHRFIFPYKGSFHLHNLKVWEYDVGNDVSRLLTLDQDYTLALEYVAATRASLSPVYRAINIIDTSISDSIKVTYQALGGVSVITPIEILQRLTNMDYSPRTTIWDSVLNVPVAFPPGIHYHESNELVYESELIEKLDEIKNAIVQSADSVASDIVDYINAL